MKNLVSLSLLLSALLELPCLAAGYQLADEIAAYNQGDYRQVIGVGQLLASQDPENAFVHYYLANSYACLGESAEAQREYIACQRLARDVQMRKYCKQALKSLRKQSTEDSEPAVVSRPAVPFSRNVAITDRGSRLIAGAKDTILQQQQVLNDDAEQMAQRRIEDIQKQARQDIAAVPKYIYLTSSQSVPNPDYDSAVKKINHDTATKIAGVQDDLDFSQRAIDKFTEQKLDGLDSSIEATQSQRREGVTSLQLAPGSAQLFVKDYLHFDLTPPPAFPASALSGMNKEVKQALKSQPQG